MQDDVTDELRAARLSTNVTLVVQLFLVPLTIAVLISVTAFLFLITEL